MLKWTGALAAAGVVGVGLGVGADLLLRPNTTKTTTETTVQTTVQSATETLTQTTTNTVTQAPVPLSFTPPLSPQVSERVESVVNSLVADHEGETEVYFSYGNTSASGALTRVADVCKVVLKNGSIVRVVPEDIVNPTIAREDAYLSEDDILNGRVRGIPWSFHWAERWQTNTPSRLLYPMLRVGARGDPNGSFVRISWDDAINTIVQEIVHDQGQVWDQLGYL